MRANFPALTTALALLLASGCAGSLAPRGWLPRNGYEAERTAYGAWIEVEYAASGATVESRGEFIAVDKGRVYVLEDSSLRPIPRADIVKARLCRFGSGHSTIAVWALLGTLSTGSHGIALIISAPVWIISGTVAASAQSRAPREDYPGADWEELRAYARFPAGMPADLGSSALQPKPYGDSSQ